MQQLPSDIDPYAHDPGRWGASLINVGEVVLDCLDAAGARSVIEVGAYAGDLTRLLLRWAEGSGARIAAIDPSPQPELEQLERERHDLELIRETSLVALEHVELADAIVLDGDHNYHTVIEELERIARRAGEQGSELPLFLLHDVGWPHGRRDDYFDPDQIPPERRQPIAQRPGLFPGVEGTRPGGLPYRRSAAREGGPANGVLTAIEDFVARRDDVALAVVPVFFGLGVIYPREAPYTAELMRVVGPWDRNPLLERLEANRVLHLAASHVNYILAQEAQQRLARLEGLVRRMLDSRAFAAAELWTRLRERGTPVFSRDEIRRLIDGE